MKGKATIAWFMQTAQNDHHPLVNNIINMYEDDEMFLVFTLLTFCYYPSSLLKSKYIFLAV
jgi:hypothetical protein